MPKEYKILLGIVIIALVGGWLLFKFGGQTPTVEPLVSRTDTYYKGNVTAPVTVTEFADFQCPACRMASGIPDQIVAAYPNDVRVIFRHFPLPNHPLSQVSAQAAEAAGEQGKFWEMYNLLFEKQDEWGDLTKSKSRSEAIALFRGYARQLGLNEEQFAKAVEDNKFAETINRDVNDAAVAGTNSTPQFFVNGTMVKEPSFEAIKEEVDKQLGK